MNSVPFSCVDGRILRQKNVLNFKPIYLQVEKQKQLQTIDVCFVVDRLCFRCQCTFCSHTTNLHQRHSMRIVPCIFNHFGFSTCLELPKIACICNLFGTLFFVKPEVYVNTNTSHAFQFEFPLQLCRSIRFVIREFRI